MTSFALPLLRHGAPETPGLLMGRTDGAPTPAGVAFSQLADHLRVASRLGKEAPDEPAAASWQRALQRTQDNRKRRRGFPADGLIPVPQRFVVAPGSAAGSDNASGFPTLAQIEAIVQGRAGTRVSTEHAGVTFR